VPIARHRIAESRSIGETPTTVQATSKSLKKTLVIFMLMFFVSALVIVLSATTGLSILHQNPFMLSLMLCIAVISLVGSIVTKIRIWWHHG